MSERLEKLKDVFRNNLRQGYSNIITNDDFEWFIKQAEKMELYEKTLEKIAEDRSVAFWELSSKVAKEALK